MIMMTKYDYGGVLGCLKCMFASCILKGTVQAKMKILSLFTHSHRHVIIFFSWNAQKVFYIGFL